MEKMQIDGLMLEGIRSEADLVDLKLLLRTYCSLGEDARRYIRAFARGVAEGQERKRRKAQRNESQAS